MRRPCRAASSRRAARRFSTVRAARSERFGGLVAVNNVSFEVSAGEILGLIGPNGAGKSTMFNLITGALPARRRPRSTFAGSDRSRPRASSRIARAGIARTFQHVKLRPKHDAARQRAARHLSAHPGRASSPAPCGSTSAEEARARHEAMRAAASGSVSATSRSSSPATCRSATSACSRSPARSPPILPLLVLDEPAAGLRRQEKLALAELLRALRAEGLTILLVEHDMEFVMGAGRPHRRDGFRLEARAKACRRRSAADARVQEAYLGGVA